MRCGSVDIASGLAPPSRAAEPAMPPVDGVVHRYVTVDGVRMHYAEAGHGEPLVLIHGFPQNWYMWRNLIPGLARHYRVIAPDLPGSGWSDAPGIDYGKEALADRIASFMRAVDAPRARVMGHDWGGFIGFILSLRHPEQVERYVALNIATPWPTEQALPDLWRFGYQPVLAAPLLGAALLRRPSFVKAMLWGASAHHPWSDADVAAFTQPWQDPAHAEAGSSMYRTFLTNELVPMIRGRYGSSTLEPRTLLLVGEQDPVIRPSVIAGFEPHARDMRAELVPGAGHFLPEEQPDVVLERTLEFFA